MNSNASLALALEPVMIVQSDLLGELAVSPEEVIRFPTGLFGFPECRSFVLIASDREGLYWLQSADHRALAFLLADPFLFFEDYAVDLTATDRADLQAEGPSDVAVLAIVTLPRSRNEPLTANLQGPLALNLGRQLGKQLAVENSAFGLRCPFHLPGPAPAD